MDENKFKGRVCTKHPALKGLRYKNGGKCPECKRIYINEYRRTHTGWKEAEARRNQPLRKKGGAYYERMLAQNKRYYARNKAWFLARNAIRRIARRVPISALCAGETLEVYRKRPPGKVVDHIVPTKGICRATKKHVVCGLHVPWNLRYIKPLKNAQKWAWFDL